MEAKIKAKLDEHNLAIEDLTQEEIEVLKWEIEEEEKGAQFLDGVLENPLLFYRRSRRKFEERMHSEAKTE